MKHKHGWRATTLTTVGGLLLGLANIPHAWAAPATGTAADFAGGNGSAGNPYQITTAQQLLNMNSDIATNSGLFGAASYALTANIDMNSQTWTPIASFSGTFDGQGHTISNLSIGGTTSYIGMFATATGTIENVRFDKVQVASAGPGTNFIGAVVGELYTGGSLTNVSASGSVVAGSTSGAVGGLAGRNDGTITTSSALGSVSGGYAVGGVAGQNSGSISNSYTNETVNATSGTGQAGGIAGFSEGAIANTYEVGKISSAGSEGGIVGLQYSPGTVTSSYWDATVNSSPAMNNGAGIGAPATTTQLQNQNTFSGWDFASTWGMSQNPNSLPYLQSSLLQIQSPPLLVVQGTSYSGQVHGIGGSAPYTWNVGQSAGPGLVFSASNGVGTFSGTAPAAGLYSLTASMTDAFGSSITQTFPLQVILPAPTGLSRTQVSTTGWLETWNTVNNATSYNVYLDGTKVGNVTGGSTTSYPFSNLKPSTSYTVQVSAIDSSGTEGLLSGNNSAATATPVPPLSVATSWLWNAQYGVPYNPLQLEATSGHGPYTWSVVDGSLPLGLSLSADGVLSGTTVAANGTSNFTVQVSDASGSNAKRTLSLQVWGAPALAISTTTLPDGVMGKSYGAQLSAVGGGPLAWTLQSGSLPNGLTLNSDGSLTGTPSASGTFSFVAQVSDGTGAHVIQALQLKITALAPDKILILWNGKSIIVPVVYRDNTTYVPVWYVMQLLHQTGVQSTWTGHSWYVQSASQPDMANIHPGTGAESIYLDGVLVQNVTPEISRDETTGQSTTYMALSSVVQLLSRLGLESNWSANVWTVTPLDK